eukprot:gene6468-8897_t
MLLKSLLLFALSSISFNITYEMNVNDHFGSRAVDSNLFVPGNMIGSFTITLSNGSTLSYDIHNKFSPFFPLIVWVTNFDDDPWSEAALLSDKSVDSFLNSKFSLGTSHYLFIPARDKKDISVLSNKIASRFDNLCINSSLRNRILYARDSFNVIASTGGSSITNILADWSSHIDYFLMEYYSHHTNSFLHFNATRLDCYWPYCGSVATSVTELYYVGDICSSFSFDGLDLQHKRYALLYASNCTYEVATEIAQNILNAAGVIMIMNPSEITLVQINQEGIYDIEIFVTSISYDNGQIISEVLLNSRSLSANITFYSVKASSGYFLVIDSNLQIQQIGSRTNAYMILASWASQYEWFVENLYSNLSEPAYVIPLVQNEVFTAKSKPVTLNKKLLLSYGTLSIDTSLTCPGNYDSSCSAWDHTISLTFTCSIPSNGNAKFNRKLEVGGTQNEIARYVTPFRRRVGRWLTDATPFMALLINSSCDKFEFQATVGGQLWYISINLRLSNPNTSPPTNFEPLFSTLASIADINSRYYNKTFAIPSSLFVSKVYLEALITTHGYDQFGCCEFLPTAHIFEINNNSSYNLTFWEAGTEWGCSDKSYLGSEPNEYGTWWYGRGGWCDGMDVKPWVIDVTNAFSNLNQDNNDNFISYHILIYYNNQWIKPDSVCGWCVLQIAIGESKQIRYVRADDDQSSQISSTSTNGLLIQNPISEQNNE